MGAGVVVWLFGSGVFWLLGNLIWLVVIAFVGGGCLLGGCGLGLFVVWFTGSFGWVVGCGVLGLLFGIGFIVGWGGWLVCTFWVLLDIGVGLGFGVGLWWLVGVGGC